MTLDKWLKKQRVPVWALAAAAKVSPSVLYRILSTADYDPRLSVALRIEKATGGVVTAADLDPGHRVAAPRRPRRKPGPPRGGSLEDYFPEGVS